MLRDMPYDTPRPTSADPLTDLLTDLFVYFGNQIQLQINEYGRKQLLNLTFRSAAIARLQAGLTQRVAVNHESSERRSSVGGQVQLLNTQRINRERVAVWRAALRRAWAAPSGCAEVSVDLPRRVGQRLAGRAARTLRQSSCSGWQVHQYPMPKTSAASGRISVVHHHGKALGASGRVLPVQRG